MAVLLIEPVQAGVAVLEAEVARQEVDVAAVGEAGALAVRGVERRW